MYVNFLIIKLVDELEILFLQYLDKYFKILNILYFYVIFVYYKENM